MFILHNFSILVVNSSEYLYNVAFAFSLIAYLLSLLGVSIFLELLMLGFQNLDSDTSDSITRRSILESADIQTIDLISKDSILPSRETESITE